MQKLKRKNVAKKKRKNSNKNEKNDEIEKSEESEESEQISTNTNTHTYWMQIEKSVKSIVLVCSLQTSQKFKLNCTAAICEYASDVESAYYFC